MEMAKQGAPLAAELAPVAIASAPPVVGCLQQARLNALRPPRLELEAVHGMTVQQRRGCAWFCAASLSIDTSTPGPSPKDCFPAPPSTCRAGRGPHSAARSRSSSSRRTPRTGTSTASLGSFSPSRLRQLVGAEALSSQDPWPQQPSRPDAAVGARRPPRCFQLESPGSCASPTCTERTSSPSTPEPTRSELTCLAGPVRAVLFDFDGTITATPGEHAQHSRKGSEVRERAPMLAPRFRVLKDAGIMLGIISKSSEPTIRSALQEAGLEEFFDGPIIAKAVGFEGKAGFIEDLVRMGGLSHLGLNGLRNVLLVDDDLRELARARAKNIQTYPAPKNGGLQVADFDAIFAGLSQQGQLTLVFDAAAEGFGAWPTAAWMSPCNWTSASTPRCGASPRRPHPPSRGTPGCRKAWLAAC
mmetsp:Transcript_17733/g.56139  ORF Transcript_17733/g.56139 Transcript_17733/m.56139 type:complete len:415 (+) Transcript_17733:89-1333(+)